MCRLGFVVLEKLSRLDVLEDVGGVCEASMPDWLA